jgi:hypothetical protein
MYMPLSLDQLWLHLRIVFLVTLKDTSLIFVRYTGLLQMCIASSDCSMSQT